MTWHSLLLPLALLPSLALAPAAPPADAPALPSGSIVGSVHDTRGLPLPFLPVQRITLGLSWPILEQETTTTNLFGNFSFHDVPVGLTVVVTIFPLTRSFDFGLAFVEDGGTSRVDLVVATS